MFKALTSLLLVFAISGIDLNAHAHGFKVGELRINHPYATPSLSGSKTGAMYIRSIHNTGKQADQLISARTPVAERVELHQMQMDNNVMKMRAVPAIDLPAQAELRMLHGSADGYHLMLSNLKQPLKDGDRFSVWLQFKNSGEREVTVHVQTPKNSAPNHNH
jgi:periplasmic copper chaperone A